MSLTRATERVVRTSVHHFKHVWTDLQKYPSVRFLLQDVYEKRVPLLKQINFVFQFADEMPCAATAWQKHTTATNMSVTLPQQTIHFITHPSPRKLQPQKCKDHPRVWKIVHTEKSTRATSCRQIRATSRIPMRGRGSVQGTGFRRLIDQCWKNCDFEKTKFGP
jgi:hypothetical protein